MYFTFSQFHSNLVHCTRSVLSTTHACRLCSLMTMMSVYCFLSLISMQCMHNKILLWQIEIHLTNASTVSKCTDISSHCFDSLVWASLYFSCENYFFTTITKFQGNPFSGALKNSGWEIFSIIAIYLGDGMRYVHSYYGTLIGSHR